MSTIELKERLIDKIQSTENQELLEEAFRLLELESDDIEVYKLSAEQLKSIKEAQDQIRNGQFLTDEQANKDIDEWLSK